MTAAALNPPPGEEPQRPAPGTLVVDEATGRIGEVMDAPWSNPIVLRPQGGGREWYAHGTVRPAKASELLRDPVAEANQRSRGELL